MNCSTSSNTLETLVPMICEHTGLRPSEVRPGMRLREDLDIDSLMLHGILMSIEDEWGVMPGAEPIARAETLADLAAEITALREGI